MRKKVLLGVLVVILMGSLVIQTPQAVLTGPEEVSILILLGHAFGWSHFEFMDVVEDWGCDVTITGNASQIQSCLNLPANPVDTDILISEIAREDLSQYDVLFVPSGGHWHHLITSEPALNLIQMAYEEGLIVSGICIGVTPVAASNVTEGHVVAGHNLCYPYVDASGGTILPLMRVVSDGQLITGDNGAGPPAGHEGAPHYDLCVAIMKSLFGYSYLEEMTVQPVLEGNDTVYYMNVTTSGQIHLFDDVTTAEITEVTAKLRTSDNETVIAEVELSDPENDSIFVGSITGLEEDDYVVDLEILDANVSMEFVRDALAFTANNITTTSTTTTVTDGILTIETVAIIGVS
ncbi:MAG: DJ-1/PfpI family protein, partial [Candidatus Thorarchaeota archaeon]